MTDEEELSDRQLRFIQVFDLLLQELDDDDRLEIFDFLMNVYCFECGGQHEHEVEDATDPHGTN